MLFAFTPIKRSFDDSLQLCKKITNQLYAIMYKYFNSLHCSNFSKNRVMKETVEDNFKKISLLIDITASKDSKAAHLLIPSGLKKEEKDPNSSDRRRPEIGLQSVCPFFPAPSKAASLSSSNSQPSKTFVVNSSLRRRKVTTAVFSTMSVPLPQLFVHWSLPSRRGSLSKLLRKQEAECFGMRSPVPTGAPQREWEHISHR